MLRKTTRRSAVTATVAQASMRPQRNAAENLRRRTHPQQQSRRASMRPQRNAAENPGIASAADAAAPCFNEAAA